MLTSAGREDNEAQAQEWSMTFSERDGFGVCSVGEDPSNPSRATHSSILLHWDQLNLPREDWFKPAQNLALSILWFLSTVPQEAFTEPETVRKILVSGTTGDRISLHELGGKRLCQNARPKDIMLLKRTKTL
jgi:hypothetical protein